jgi:hypothetical protein
MALAPPPPPPPPVADGVPAWPTMSTSASPAAKRQFAADRHAGLLPAAPAEGAPAAPHSTALYTPSTGARHSWKSGCRTLKSVSLAAQAGAYAARSAVSEGPLAPVAPPGVKMNEVNA